MIVSYEYYTNTFFGTGVSQTDFPRYEATAARSISTATRGRVTESNIGGFPQAIQTAYKNAVCSQIAYYAEYGLDVAVAGISGEGFTVGKVTVHGGSRFPVGRASMICAEAVALLEQTGLLNPQIETRDAPFLPFYFRG